MIVADSGERPKDSHGRSALRNNLRQEPRPASPKKHLVGWRRRLKEALVRDTASSLFSLPARVQTAVFYSSDAFVSALALAAPDSQGFLERG